MIHEYYFMILNVSCEIVNTQIMNHHEGMKMTLGKLIGARLYPHTPMTAKEFAGRIGRSASYVSQLVNDQKQETPPPDVMAGIERVLGIPVVMQLRAWGYDLPDDAPPLDPYVAEFIDLLPYVDEIVMGAIRRMTVGTNHQAMPRVRTG